MPRSFKADPQLRFQYHLAWQRGVDPDDESILRMPQWKFRRMFEWWKLEHETPSEPDVDPATEEGSRGD